MGTTHRGKVDDALKNRFVMKNNDSTDGSACAGCGDDVKKRSGLGWREEAILYRLISGSSVVNI